MCPHSARLAVFLLFASMHSQPAGVGAAKVGHLVDGEQAKDLAKQHEAKQLSAKELEQISGGALEDELLNKKTGQRTPLHEFSRPGGAGARVPDQLRVSWGSKVDTEMTVSWVTYAPPTRPYVRYAPLEEDGENPATLLFSGGGLATIAHITNLTRARVNIEEYVMRCTLKGLVPNVTYAYVCGDYWPQQPAENRGALSDVNYFRTLPEGTRWAPRLLMFGDVGTDTAVPAAKITEMVKRGHADAVFHLGDIAYSLVKNSGTVGDRWMRIVAPFAANVPYMVTPGDHDLRWGKDTWDMQQRFAMPGWRSVAGHPGAVLGRWGGLWWSIDVGPVHIASYNTEMWHTHNDLGIVRDGWMWLRDDLEKANANRDKVPWVVTLAHTPMYTSGFRKRKVKRGKDGKPVRGTAYTQGFDPLSQKHRFGPPRFPGWDGEFPFRHEKLLKDMKVDMSFQAHWHNYERFLPAYDGKPVVRGGDPYTDIQAPVHINIGHGGRGHEPFDRKPLPMSARRISARGFGMIHPVSDSELLWTAYNCDFDHCTGEITDFVAIKRTNRSKQRYASVGTGTPEGFPPLTPATMEGVSLRLPAHLSKLADENADQLAELRKEEQVATAALKRVKEQNDALKAMLEKERQRDPHADPLWWGRDKPLAALKTG